MPFAKITALCLLLSLLFSKDRQRIPINSISIPWILFLLWMLLTTIFSYYTEPAFEMFSRVIKIQLISLITIVLINNIEKLRQLIWVIVLSIGYFSIKGGLFTILTGGSHRVWGPPGSYIEDNNALAVAVIMVIPLMIYLYQTVDNQKVKTGMLVAVILSFFTALGSQSRGALLAIGAIGLIFWLKSSSKILSGGVIAVMVSILLVFMPETWYQRMNTMQTYDSDHSAMTRLSAWEYALNVANDNIIGLGFQAFSYETFLIYNFKAADQWQGAHSIYFLVLGDHGWPGLFLFLLIFFQVRNVLKGIIKKTNDDENLKEYNILAKMILISFVAYLVGGAFLSLSYYDLPWHLVSFVVILKIMVDKAVNTRVAEHDFS